MSAIPPANANLVSGVIQSAAAQKHRAAEKAGEDIEQSHLAREQSRASDQQEHEVEDTLHTEDTRVRRHDEEESHQQRRHRHRALPEDNQPSDSQDAEDAAAHIDLQA